MAAMRIALPVPGVLNKACSAFELPALDWRVDDGAFCSLVVRVQLWDRKRNSRSLFGPVGSLDLLDPADYQFEVLARCWRGRGRGMDALLRSVRAGDGEDMSGALARALRAARAHYDELRENVALA
jgi:hypothetical protein